MSKERQSKLVGPVVSLPTFTDEDHNLLLDKQRKHIRWLIDNGFKNGEGVILVAGGYGEGYFLDDYEYHALIDVLKDEVKDEVPSMIGIFDLSARKAAERAKYAADAGVEFIELGLPHYSCPSEEDVYLHHKYVSDHADIGIMSYNNFWVMPSPGFEISEKLIERLVDVENMDGFKWSSGTEDHYVGMLKKFSGRFNFIDNGMQSALGARNGMAGFVDFYGNVAPRLSRKTWDLFKNKKFDELDDLLYRVHAGPAERLADENPGFSGVADGTFGTLRWEVLGLKSGPVFPSQQMPSDAVRQYTNKLFKEGGLFDWVDWNDSVVE